MYNETKHDDEIPNGVIKGLTSFNGIPDASDLPRKRKTRVSVASQPGKMSVDHYTKSRGNTQKPEMHLISRNNMGIIELQPLILTRVRVGSLVEPSGS